MADETPQRPCKRARLDGASVWKPHLILHFDVNKTIIISDPVSGMTVEKMINSLLSEIAWGTVVDDAWRLDTALAANPSSHAPPAPAIAYPATGYSHLTFSDYVEGVLRLPRKERKAAKGRFTESGEPGAKLRDDYTKLVAALRPVPELAVRLSQREAGTVPKMLRGGEFFLLPSFFQLLRYLADTKRDFTLVFRTFGTDLPEVAEELNCFYEGKHPYEEFSCDSKRRQLRLPDDSGSFHRTAAGTSLAYVVGATRLVGVLDGFDAIFSHIEGDGDRSVLGLRDCFSWWSKQGESDDSGKLIAANRSLLGYRRREKEEQEALAPMMFHHIFFDDNIERDRAHIVDCRDRQTGEPVPFAFALNKFIFKSEPFHAILDRDYFVKALATCEENVGLYKES